MTEPLISVVIVNWNSSHYLDRCISSLKGQSYPNFEVIVVDNGSTDDSVSLIKDKYGDFARLICLKKNLGFGKGINIGINASQGEFIAILNNDAEADPHWLKELLKGFRMHKNVGMCASKILLYNRRNVIDKVGHLIYKDGLNKGRGAMEEDLGQYNSIEEVFSADGCAAMYKKAMLEEIGLFDEDFFAYGEDAEIGMRGRMFGWKCIYMPTAIVYHIHSGTYGIYSPLKVFLVERNRLWLAIKLFPLKLLIKSPYYTFLRFIWNTYSLISGQGAAAQFTKEYSKGKLFLILVRAYLSGLAGLPKILKKRVEIQMKKKVSKTEIEEWFETFKIEPKELALKD